MTEWRSGVEIPGIPFFWNTSLPDDRIKNLYELLLKRKFFVGLAPEEGLKYENGAPVIRFAMRLKEEVVQFEGISWRVLLAADTIITEPLSE